MADLDPAGDQVVVGAGQHEKAGGDIDLGLAVVIAQDLPRDAAAVLAELIDKRLARAIADAYDRGFHEAGGRQ